MAFLAAIPAVAWAATSAVAGLATAGISAMGAMQQGNAAAEVSNYNAQIDQQNAIQAQDAATANAQIVAQTTKRQMGQAAAAYGAGGVDMTGSPLAVMSDLASQGELNRQMQLYQGTLQARSATQQSAIDTASASTQQEAGLERAGSTLLTAGSSAFRTMQPYFPTSGAGSSPAAVGGNQPL